MYVCITIFLSSYLLKGIMGTSKVLTVMHKAAININTQVFVCTFFCFLVCVFRDRAYLPVI